jgi:hypothetical protein
MNNAELEAEFDDAIKSFEKAKDKLFRVIAKMSLRTPPEIMKELGEAKDRFNRAKARLNSISEELAKL